MTRMDPHENATKGRRRHFAVLGALLACLATAALVAAAAPAKPTATTGGQTAALQNDLDALVAAGAPGAILLVRNGNHTTRLTAGLADVRSKRPMRAADRFRIASVTKSYTASVVLQLVAAGKLGLGDSIERRLPKLVPNGKAITIRQLLNHTSGLYDFESDPRYLKPYLGGNLGLLPASAAARPDRRLAQAALRAGSTALVLEHELRRRRSDRRGGHR